MQEISIHKNYELSQRAKKEGVVGVGRLTYHVLRRNSWKAQARLISRGEEVLFWLARTNGHFRLLPSHKSAAK